MGGCPTYAPLANEKICNPDCITAGLRGIVGAKASAFQSIDEQFPLHAQSRREAGECLRSRMRRSATLIALLLACAASSAQKPAPSNQSTSNSPSTLKVDVKLVNVYVTVTDAHGGPVAGLKKENFIVQEDGRDQTISVFDKESAVPLSIALAIDTSLSTRHDLPLEQTSAKRFAHAIMRPDDALSVYGFSETVFMSTALTSDLKRIDSGIDHLRLGAATALFDA